MTAEDFRELVLAFEGTVESSHMGHPDFRANGRIFATLHTGETLGMVKLLPDEQRALLRSHPAMFVPSAGAWGRSGCTNVKLAAGRRGDGAWRAAARLAARDGCAAAEDAQDIDAHREGQTDAGAHTAIGGSARLW